MQLSISRSLLAAAVLAAPLAAGGLHRERVPADARWVGHVDVERFLASGLWREILARQAASEGSDGVTVGLLDMHEIREELGLDPLRDVRSVTFYGQGEDEEDAVVLVEATSAVDEALTHFAQQEGYALRSVGGLQLHTFDGDAFVHVQDDGAGGRLVTIGHHEAMVVDAVRVLHAQAPSLASRGDRLAAQPLADSFFFLTCTDGIPGIHEIDPDSQVANLATGLVLDVGQAGSALYVRADVQTADVDSALNLGDVLDGLVALGKLALHSQDVPADLGDLLRALQVETRGTSVWIEFRYDVQRLFDLVEELSEESW